MPVITRMSNEAINWALKQHAIRNSEKTVLIILANRANEQHQCWPSHQTIADDAGLGLSTVRQALAVLREKGLVHWQRREKPGTEKNLSNLYRLPVKARSSTPPDAGPVQNGPLQISTPTPPDPGGTPSSNWSDLPPDTGAKPKEEPPLNPKEPYPLIQTRAGYRVGIGVNLS